jgi:hypothetical protein
MLSFSLGGLAAGPPRTSRETIVTAAAVAAAVATNLRRVILPFDMS